ncbi:MAG: glycosyltransferase, partial [Terriglobales bacterium]
MFISVLICTHKRPDSLRRTLASLLCPSNVSQGEWEVIVVREAGCDESTARVCDEFAESFPDRARFLVHESRGKSVKMNAAIAEARGGILAMTDDDVSVAPDYVQAIRAVF